MTQSVSWLRQIEAKKATTTMHSRRWESSRRQPPPCNAEDGNPEGNNLRLGTMKTEPSSEPYETFSIQIQLLHETGYQLQEERCKSGTMQNTLQPDYRMLGKGSFHVRPKKNIRIHPTKTRNKQGNYKIQTLFVQCQNQRDLFLLCQLLGKRQN